MTVEANPLCRPADVRRADPAPAVRAFHRAVPGYAPTALHAAPALAEAWGVGAVWLKDESERFGLPSFKVLGASWAIRRALGERLGLAPDAPLGIVELAAAAELDPATLVTATDGNHGRAVARMAKLLGLDAHVLVPAGTAAARIDAIASEGARVQVIDGDYDDAVAHSARLGADPGRLVIADTAWPGYEQVPRWVVEGYGTIFAEAGEQLAAAGAASPAVLVVPVGVGSLAAAAIRHARPDTALVGFEPQDAACLLESVRAGRIVTVPGPHRSVMAGLNCGTLSLLAWPELAAGLRAAMTIGDAAAEAGMRRLAELGIAGGEVAGGSVAAAEELLTSEHWRSELGVGPDTGVMLVLTEGPTDPEHYRQVVGADLSARTAR